MLELFLPKLGELGEGYGGIQAVLEGMEAEFNEGGASGVESEIKMRQRLWCSEA